MLLSSCGFFLSWNKTLSEDALSWDCPPQGGGFGRGGVLGRPLSAPSAEQGSFRSREGQPPEAQRGGREPGWEGGQQLIAPAGMSSEPRFSFESSGVLKSLTPRTTHRNPDFKGLGFGLGSGCLEAPPSPPGHSSVVDRGVSDGPAGVNGGRQSPVGRNCPSLEMGRESLVYPQWTEGCSPPQGLPGSGSLYQKYQLSGR